MNPTSRSNPPPGTPESTGTAGASGTTERDHGGRGSWMPERAQGEDRSHEEGGLEGVEGSGASDVRRGPTGAERRDSDGTVPDTGMDRDSGAGAAGGHDRGGAEASRQAQRTGRQDGGERRRP